MRQMIDSDSEFANPECGFRTEVRSMQASRQSREHWAGNQMANECYYDRKPTFPEILMEILNDEANQGILRWMPCGMRFTITNYRKFVEEHLERIFHIRHMSSFVRKLNRWGFMRELVDGNLDVFEHPCFRRDQPEMCKSMRNVIEDRPKKSKPRKNKADISSSCGKSPEESYNINNSVSAIAPAVSIKIASRMETVNQISPTSTAPYSGTKTSSRDHHVQEPYHHKQQLHRERSNIRSGAAQVSLILPSYHHHHFHRNVRSSPRVVEVYHCPRQSTAASATLQQYQRQPAAHSDDANHFAGEDYVYNCYWSPPPLHAEYNRQHAHFDEEPRYQY